MNNPTAIKSQQELLSVGTVLTLKFEINGKLLLYLKIV